MWNWVVDAQGVGAFNQEKALVGAFSVIVKTNCETDESFYSTKHHCRQLHHGHGHLVPRLPAVALRHLPGEVADRVGLVSPRRDHETFPGKQ